MREIQTTHESGFTLLELLLVVGVGALLLIGGIATYRQVTAGNQTNEAQRDLQRVASSVRTAYQSQNDYTDLDTDTAIQLGVFPGLAVGTTPTNSFGGDLTVAVNGTDSRLFDLTMTDVPEAACIQLATSIQDPAELEELTIDGTSPGAIPLGIADVTAECGTTPPVDMVFTLR
jgi:type II secretory pathway pseudopilin PulG